MFPNTFCRLIPPYEELIKIFALFFGAFREILYLCTVKLSFTKIQPHATKPMYDDGTH